MCKEQVGGEVRSREGNGEREMRLEASGIGRGWQCSGAGGKWFEEFLFVRPEVEGLEG